MSKDYFEIIENHRIAFKTIEDFRKLMEMMACLSSASGLADYMLLVQAAAP